MYSDPSNYNFLSIHAITEVSQDRSKINQYWNKMIEGWFEKGKEDSQIRVLKVIPPESHYWDTKSNKLVTFFKEAISGITGSKTDLGRQRDLNIDSSH